MQTRKHFVKVYVDISPTDRYARIAQLLLLSPYLISPSRITPPVRTIAE